MTSEPYHYTGCGLEWVYLANGFEVQDTPYGLAVTIQDIDGLHNAIALDIIAGPAPIRGRELRFLRSLLDLSQEGLGQIAGLSRSQIARFEGEPDAAITPTVDHAIRLYLALRHFHPDLAARVEEVLNERDDQQHQPASFAMGERWARAA